MHSVTPRLSGTPGGFRLPAPAIGQHNEEIYGRAGYSAEQLKTLASRGII